MNNLKQKQKEKSECFEPGRYIPGFLLWKVSTIWQRVMAQELKQIGLTPAQFYLLSGLEKLSQVDKSVSQVELATFVQMSVMMTSSVIRKLEKKGYIRRIPHPEDPRANCLELTEAGKIIRNQAIEISVKANEKFFDVNKKETKEFMEYLKKLVERDRESE